MHFLLFLPGLGGTGDHRLQQAGLGHLVQPGDHQPTYAELVDQTPAGTPGVLVSWLLDGAGDLNYRPDRQHWVPESVCEGREPAYWVGWSKDGTPDPQSLQRTVMIPGQIMELGDGRFWEIPSALQVPKRLMLRQGTWQPVVDQRYAAFVEQSLWALQACTQALEGKAPANLTDVIDYALAALSWNYRLVPELVSEMGLFRLGDQFAGGDLFRLLAYTTDLERLQTIVSDLSKKGAPPTRSG